MPRKKKKTGAGRVAKWNEKLGKDHKNVQDDKLRDLLKEVDRVVDKQYKRNEKATEKGKKKDLYGKVTSDNYAKGILYTARQYATYLYENHGITDLRWSKKEHGNEFVRDMMRRAVEKEDDFDEVDRKNVKSVAIGTIHDKISHLNKFEEMLNVVHQEEHNKRRSYRIINNKEIRKELKDEGLFRSEFKGRKIDNEEEFNKVTSFFLKKAEKEEAKIEEIKKNRTLHKTIKKQMIKEQALKAEENRLYAKVWNFQGETGNRVDAAFRHRVKDIKTNEKEPEKNTTETKFGKKGKVYDVTMVEPKYVEELAKENEGRGGNSKVFTINKSNGEERSTDNLKKRYQDALKEAAKETGLDDVSSHSARKYFTHKVYHKALNFTEQEMMDELKSKPHIYMPAIRNLVDDKKEKRLYNERNYVAAKKKWSKECEVAKSKGLKPKPFKEPENWKKWKKEFDRTGNLPSHLSKEIPIKHEELAAIIGSVQSGHNGRISILKHYIKRQFKKYQNTYPAYSRMFHKGAS